MKYFYYTIIVSDSEIKKSGVVESDTGLFPVLKVIKYWESRKLHKIRIIYSTEITSDEYKELV